MIPQSDILTISKQIDTRWLQMHRGFITGASGWFGKWICQTLETIGAPCLKLWHTDEVNIENFRIPDQKMDYIIHLAPGRVDRVIECAQRHDVQAVLFTSSGAVYADPPNEYGQIKIDNEWAMINGEIPVKIARCFTFAGAGIPLHKGLALGNFIGQALDGDSLHIWSDGQAIRTYLYMTDLVTWLFNILIKGDFGKPYDVGGELEVSILDVAHIVRAQFYPPRDILIENSELEEPMPYYVPDITDAYDLGCRITVPSDEAIRKTVWYYKERYDN